MNQHGIQVLLIEDNPGDARLVQEMLRDVSEISWRVIHVDRLDSGLELLTTKRFDICLLDLFLPDSKSDTTIEQLGRFFDLPIVVMTGLDDAEMGYKALKNGAQDYIVKSSLDGQGLARTIRYAMERYRLEQRISKMFNSSNDVILLLDPESERILEANPAASIILGYSHDDLLATALETLTKQHSESWRTYLASILEKKKEQSTQLSLMSRSHQELQFEASASVIEEQGKHPIVVTMRDVTERKRLLKELEFHTNYDSVTALPNRKFLEKQFRMLSNRQRHSNKNERLALIYIDINGFNRVNASFGNHVGDIMLKEIAQKMRLILRSHEIIGYVGSDEFAVLIPSKHERTTLGVAKRLSDAINDSYKVTDDKINLSISLGIANYSGQEDFGDLLNYANQAMYRSKKEGQLISYSDKLNTELEKWLWIERSFRDALQDNAFELYFQPIVNSTAETPKAEALLRWFDNEQGFISPGVFIPIVEEVGCIQELDFWVLQEAIRLASEGDFQVSVNISSETLQSFEFKERLQRSLEAYDFPTHYLTLEVTERLLAHPESIMPIFNDLKACGVKLAIDDFGTGYSSLSYLHEYPIDNLKIDRSLTCKLPNDDRAAAVAEMVIKLSNRLGMAPILEGVETNDQLNWAMSNQCAEIQGYLTGKPMPYDAFLNWIASQSRDALETQVAPQSPKKALG